jgi:hypothetical protein
LSELIRETDKITELVNRALILNGITDTLVDDLDLTYAKARKTEATVSEMSVQLDDARSYLRNSIHGTCNYLDNLMTYRVQSTELRVLMKTKSKINANSKLESRV